MLRGARHVALPKQRQSTRVLSAVAGVVGEILVTFAVIVLLFVAWELWWTNIDAGREQSDLTSKVVQDQRPFDTEPTENLTEPSVEPVPSESATSKPTAAPSPGSSPPKQPEPTTPAKAAKADRELYGPPPEADTTAGDAFGVLYVPRFGSDYARPIGNGVGIDVLNNVGIGHYPSSQPPGANGNFAVAGHRQTHGQVFWDIDKLTDGDYLYLQTRDGYYTYRYRSTEIVDPSDNEVLLPVPHHPGQKADESLMTMTSCHPPFTTRMRIIAYSELESWRPAKAGAPAPIADAVKKAEKRG